MILVGGENLVDLIQTDTDADHPVFRAVPGGGPYNCAKAIGKQQQPVRYLTPISSDPMGQLLSDGLTQSGVQMAPRSDKPSSLAVVSLVDGAPTYRFYRENTAERQVSLAALNAQVTPDVSAVYLGSLAIVSGADADVWQMFYGSLKERGVFTTLDPNIRPTFITDRGKYQERLDKILMSTDLLKLSDEDLTWLYPGSDWQEAAGLLAKKTMAAMIVVTRGAAGSAAFIGDRMITAKAAHVEKLQDTVGAGDTFMATLIAGLAQAELTTVAKLNPMDDPSVLAMLNRAATAAAMNCEKPGCQPPTLAQLDHRIAGD